MDYLSVRFSLVDIHSMLRFLSLVPTLKANLIRSLKISWMVYYLVHTAVVQHIVYADNSNRETKVRRYQRGVKEMQD